MNMSCWALPASRRAPRWRPVQRTAGCRKQVVSEGATSLLWFEHPAERFLLVTDVATANASPTRCAAKRSSTTASSGWR
jgi:hypothetical protein